MSIHSLQASSRAKLYQPKVVPPEIHDTPDALRLKESCQQFESILWAQIWKKMKSNAQSISGVENDRPWKQMENLTIEMAAEELSKSGGAGLWKVLYDQMVLGLVDAKEAGNDTDA